MASGKAWFPAPTRAVRAGGAIREGRVVVKGAAEGYVIEAATAGTVPGWGVSVQAASAAEDVIDVACVPGTIVKAEAGAAITFGDRCTFNNAGELIAASAGTEYVVGIALESAADGAYFQLQLTSMHVKWAA